MSSYWSKRKKINKLAHGKGARKEKSKQPGCNLSAYTSKDLGANENVEEKDVTVGQPVMQSHTICENVLVDDNTAVPVVQSNENRELRYAGNAVSSIIIWTLITVRMKEMMMKINFCILSGLG